jgi:ubiquinone/menaquinone biosynthesis C-methylase UbiE
MSFLTPKQVLTALRITPGQQVADFGCGRGEYIMPLSEAVAELGTIYALDVHKALLTKISREVQEAVNANVKTIWFDLEETNQNIPIATESLDAVIISNVLFQIEDKNTVAVQAYTLLKKGGKVLCIDWDEKSDSKLVKKDMVLSQEKSKEIFEENGFSFSQEVPAGSHHYAYIFVKK